ncbi:hypothetical protein [Pseudodesulfovibrio tunisiensis]|uniref:hypothetical protein n=1 Tax=Pseudodesulfovibrio tunisiensis TaxID=463192 RepID=UPI001FB2B136|nr:hypothetical protein [Pseudodesulfovibrio tunisiensis]
MTATYPYTGEDRIRKPHSYMYTPFVGTEFFSAYADDRSRTLMALGGHCPEKVGMAGFLARAASLARQELSGGGSCLCLSAEALRSLPEFVHEQDPAAEPLPESTDRAFQTLPVLHSLLVAVRDGEDVGQWLEFLVHRFEVSKRIRVGYNLPDGLADGFAELGPYALFSVLLALEYSRTRDLRLVNALLKCNDIVGSVCAAPQSPGDAAFGVVAVLLEVQAVNSLLEEQGGAAWLR